MLSRTTLHLHFLTSIELINLLKLHIYIYDMFSFNTQFRQYNLSTIINFPETCHQTFRTFQEESTSVNNMS